MIERPLQWISIPSEALLDGHIRLLEYRAIGIKGSCTGYFVGHSNDLGRFTVCRGKTRAVRSYESLAVCFAPQDHGSGFVLGLAAVLI